MRNKRGEGYIPICVTTVILSMLLSVFISFVSAVHVIRQTERNARIVLDSFVTTNAIAIYDSIKNGGDDTEAPDDTSYILAFSSFNSLDFRDGMLYRDDENGTELYRTTVPCVGFVQDKHLKVQSSFVITVPLYFAGVQVTEVTVPITVVSRWNEKF